MHPIKSQEDLERFVNDSNQIALVYFTAKWCNACKSIKPWLDALEHPIASIDIDEHPDLADAYQVESIPSIVYYQKGLHMKQTSDGADITIVESADPQVHEMILKDLTMNSFSMEEDF
jgi:thioredoxin 1